ncbi:MAG: L-serine ammonia-lyase, partial [Halieaceae bacterium]|nr:L-serine ammonia-lyase [Halieaceae bacterium]
MYSFFDTFKIGLGPSSSHTMGPMLAARHFRSQLTNQMGSESIRVSCTLYGSLGATGSGHGSIKAIAAGLDDHEPASIDHQELEAVWENISQTNMLKPLGSHSLHFDPEHDLALSETRLPLHSNGIEFIAKMDGKPVLASTYYSIGGGVIADAEGQPIGPSESAVPHPFTTAAELLNVCEERHLTIAEIAWQNECALQDENHVAEGVSAVWEVMCRCIRSGLSAEGVMPGELGVKRRAKTMYQRLSDPSRQQIFNRDQRAVVYAMAVNEENACGHRVVTAPTNGAAGIIPAVLQFCLDDLPKTVHQDTVNTFLLTASAVGSLFKRNASISGAEVGCQGEVGAASSMAAAGLAAAWGATP